MLKNNKDKTVKNYKKNNMYNCYKITKKSKLMSKIVKTSKKPLKCITK